MQFTTTIELGNDQMQTADDVAEALGKISRELLERYRGVLENGACANIFDANGNIVGHWLVKTK